MYAPVEYSCRCTFFSQHLLPCLPTQWQLMVAGDFNCVGRGLDVIGGEVGSRGHGYAGVEEAFDLADAWRLQHPQSREFIHTASTASGTSIARLDRVLVSSSLSNQVAVSQMELLTPRALPNTLCNVYP